MLKSFTASLLLVLSTSTASANISVECGYGLDENEFTFSQVVFSASSEGWLEGTSGKDFDLSVYGADVLGAKAEGSSSSGITIEVVMDGLGPRNVGYTLEIDAWDDVVTTGRKRTQGGFAGGLTTELQCTIAEM